MKQVIFGLFVASILVGTAHAADAPKQIDPLAITVDQRDADRFAKLMAETGDKPTAEQVQRGYLDGSGRGVAVFTPNRIENAENLAKAIAADPARYRYAINTCLPEVAKTNAELRAVYLAYRGLLPDFRPPTVHVVFGAGNSGGTALPDAQVLGLEVNCGPGTTVEQFRAAMRSSFAHETVHSWQSGEPPAKAADEFLLFVALREGVCDYLASLVTGAPPNPVRDAWGRQREKWLWAEFQKDRARVKKGSTGPFQINADGQAAFGRWLGNYGNAPEGWPFEAGYWVGMRIAAAYVERAPDRAKAIRELIELKDPAAILAASGYNPKG